MKKGTSVKRSAPTWSQADWARDEKRRTRRSVWVWGIVGMLVLAGLFLVFRKSSAQVAHGPVYAEVT